MDEAKKRCVDDIVVACNNERNVQVFSGPAEAIGKLIDGLKAEDIYVRDVKSSGVAFHSKHMEIVAPAFKAALQKVS